jgi:hypothetical protein
MTLLAARLSYTAAWALSATSRPGALQLELEEIAVAVVISVAIFELVRRKRLMERYAILWLVAGATVLVLSLAQGAIQNLAQDAGVTYAPSALFAIAFLFVLVMLVQFSMTISRLSDQNTALAQRLALLQQRLEAEQPGADGHGAAAEPAGAAGGRSGPTDPA